MTKRERSKKIDGLIAYFKALPEGAIRQPLWMYERGCGCVGAHAAYYLEGNTDYRVGLELLAQLFYPDDAEAFQRLDYGLRKCGSGEFTPFSIFTWATPPAVVLARLKKRVNL